jgi:hypothetical protein
VSTETGALHKAHSRAHIAVGVSPFLDGPLGDSSRIEYWDPYSLASMKAARQDNLDDWIPA